MCSAGRQESGGMLKNIRGGERPGKRKMGGVGSERRQGRENKGRSNGQQTGKEAQTTAQRGEARCSGDESRG